jgi:hypothetical protein
MLQEAILSSGSGNENAYERAMGVNKIHENYSKFASWTSAHGSTLNGEYERLAFNVAQPKYMIMGFMIVVIIVCSMVFVSFNAEWYNSTEYKLVLGLAPIAIFGLSWLVQFSSNTSKDNTFKDILDYNKVVRTQPVNVNAV